MFAPLIILGSGPAGWTAALYAARANLKPVVIAGIEPGGQLTTTTDVDNWPADDKGVQGPELMERFARHGQKFGAQLINDHIESAKLDGEQKTLCGGEKEYQCHALIIATGASAKYLGLPSEQHYKGRGVSACATCDGFFHRGKPVVVVGGGNTAVEESLYLANIAEKVMLVHRREKLRAEAVLQERFFARVNDGKIRPFFDSVLDEVLGDDGGVSGAKLRGVKSGAIEEVAASGVFIAVGHSPNTSLFAGQLDMRDGYIRTGKGQMMTATGIDGVFAAGDVQDSVYRQAVT
ncbi:MAG: NAD(P)/FAD-dependent oxidoreductase, partial [Gammaproteobacteria bacterium]